MTNAPIKTPVEVVHVFVGDETTIQLRDPDGNEIALDGGGKDYIETAINHHARLVEALKNASELLRGEGLALTACDIDALLKEIEDA